jgi:NADH-quinone oxidoreductase subunit J
MVEAIAFYTLSALILLFGILVISARNTVHSVLFLVVNFLFVAALYVLLRAQFLAVIQVIVYAGGIVVLYLFVVMLVNLKRPPEVHKDPQRRSRLALVLASVVFAEFAAIVLYGRLAPLAVPKAGGGTLTADNMRDVGIALYTNYLVPFEVASILLLVAMVGAIVLAKKDA